MARNIFQTDAYIFIRVATASEAAGTWVADRRLWGVDGDGHFCWPIRKRVT